VYAVNADANGFFKFYPQELPILDYYLYVISPTTLKGFDISTSTFALQNKSYLESKKITLTKDREEMKLLSSSKIRAKKNTSSESSSFFAPPKQQASSDSDKALQSNVSPQILVIVVVITLLVIALAVIFIFIKQKKQSQDFM